MARRKGVSQHKYTEEQIQFIRDNVTGRSYKELTEMFNALFDTQCTAVQIGSKIKYLGLLNGRNTRFYKGQASWNEGKKGVRVSPDTEFKVGHTPANHRLVGAERVNIDGYIEIKVAEPRTWRPKHRVLWEAENGPVPAGSVLIFADGDKTNTAIDNLILVTRAELAVLNKNRLLVGGAKEMGELGVQVARLKIAMHKRQKKE